MLRSFETHAIRKTRELEGVWTFTALDGESAGKPVSVAVPSCWQSYAGYESYRGRASYETTFPAEGNVRIEFKGVSHYARVLVDGTEVGEHYNAYTPFEVVCRNLAPGEHRLRVLVDNEFRPHYTLNKPNDYMSYGGISRSVGLETIGDAYLSQVHVTPKLSNRGEWTARVDVWGTNIGEETIEATIDVAILRHRDRRDVAIPQGTSLLASFDIACPDARPWSPDHPRLTTVTTRIICDGTAVDDLIDRFGFRVIEVRGPEVLLNGRPIKIKGFNRHEDHALFGSALPLQAMMKDIDLLSDLGANAIRTCHYPNDELFLDLCDENGILVWEEHHARGIREDEMRNPLFPEQSERVTREMIMNHYNHPSIWIWGILNESASNTEFGRGIYERHYDLIRSLDATRPCSSATCLYADDICLDLPSVVSWNMYPYWYESKSATQMITEQRAYTSAHGGEGKPFLITEMGAGAIYGFRDDDKDVWTEQMQAEILRKQLTEALSMKDVLGVYIWQFADNRVDREYWGKRPRRRNNKGVVNDYRQRKLAYDTVREIFHRY